MLCECIGILISLCIVWCCVVLCGVVLIMEVLGSGVVLWVVGCGVRLRS